MEHWLSTWTCHLQVEVSSHGGEERVQPQRKYLTHIALVNSNLTILYELLMISLFSESLDG